MYALYAPRYGRWTRLLYIPALLHDALLVPGYDYEHVLNFFFVLTDVYDDLAPASSFLVSRRNITIGKLVCSADPPTWGGAMEGRIVLGDRQDEFRSRHDFIIMTMYQWIP